MTEFVLFFNMPQTELKSVGPNRSYSALNLQFSLFLVGNHCKQCDTVYIYGSTKCHSEDKKPLWWETWYCIAGSPNQVSCSNGVLVCMLSGEKKTFCCAYLDDSWFTWSLAEALVHIQIKRMLNNEAVPTIDVAGIVVSTKEIMTEWARESSSERIYNEVNQGLEKLTIYYIFYIFTSCFFIVKVNHQ